MTGPEHYREAERILEHTSLEDHYRNYHLQAAQVHATLALADFFRAWTETQS